MRWHSTTVSMLLRLPPPLARTTRRSDVVRSCLAGAKNAAAPTGNRTRGPRVGGEDFTTKPSALRDTKEGRVAMGYNPDGLPPLAEEPRESRAFFGRRRSIGAATKWRHRPPPPRASRSKARSRR